MKSNLRMQIEQYKKRNKPKPGMFYRVLSVPMRKTAVAESVENLQTADLFNSSLEADWAASRLADIPNHQPMAGNGKNAPVDDQARPLRRAGFPVMAVKNYGTDEEWQAALLAQQARLIEFIKRDETETEKRKKAEQKDKEVKAIQEISEAMNVKSHRS